MAGSPRFWQVTKKIVLQLGAQKVSSSFQKMVQKCLQKTPLIDVSFNKFWLGFLDITFCLGALYDTALFVQVLNAFAEYRLFVLLFILEMAE